jgi:tripartite-type tricarboxylate transporter receptor subunit TctC
MNRRQTLQTLALMGSSGTAAWAQSAQGKVLVGFSAGGSVDLLARQVAEGLSSRSGRTFIVENRVGAAGRLAIEATKAAKPDGDTLLVCPQGPLTLFPYVFKNLKFDPFKDLTLIARLTTFDVAIGLGPASGADSIQKFIAWAKANPSKANFGSSGQGTLLHFTGTTIGQKTGVPLTHVPYKGAAPAVADLLAGSVPMVVAPMSDMLEYHKAGRLKMVAITSAQRSPLAPDIPTLKESDIDVEVPGWFALCGPAGIPVDELKRRHQMVAEVMSQTSVKERMLRMGMISAVLTPEESLKAQRNEYAMWGPMVKASGFTPED